MEQQSLEDMTLEELKAMGYDLIALSEQTQNQLAAVNRAIASKAPEPQDHKEKGGK